MRKLECLLCGAYFHWVRVSGARSERISSKHTRYLEINVCCEGWGQDGGVGSNWGGGGGGASELRH